MGKKSSNGEGARAMGAKASPQLELSFARTNGTGSNIVTFPRTHSVSRSSNSFESALRRLLDHAATLPGK